MKFLRIMLILFLFSLSSRCNPFQSLIDYANGVWDGALDGISDTVQLRIDAKNQIILIHTDTDGEHLVMLLYYDDTTNVDGYDVVAGHWEVVEGDKTRGIGRAMHDTYGFIVFKKESNGDIGIALSEPHTQAIKVNNITISDINGAFLNHPLAEFKKEN